MVARKEGGAEIAEVSMAQWFSGYRRWTEATTTLWQTHQQWILLQLLNVPAHHHRYQQS